MGITGGTSTTHTEKHVLPSCVKRCRHARAATAGSAAGRHSVPPGTTTESNGTGKHRLQGRAHQVTKAGAACRTPRMAPVEKLFTLCRALAPS